jgi:hypothetical protein
MADNEQLILMIHPSSGDVAGDLDELTALLRSELLDMDVQSVEQLSDEEIPEGAKGVGDIAGWLVVNLSPDAILTVVTKVADWVTRNRREVEVSYGGDTLKLGKATREQQQRIVDAWLAKNAPGS